MEYNHIVESFVNGQKKQALEQFNDLYVSEQLEFLQDNITDCTNTQLLVFLIKPLVEANSELRRIKYIEELTKDSHESKN